MKRYEAEPTKITCPHCGSNNCFMEIEEMATSYMCMGCGYTSTSMNRVDSAELKAYEEITPQLMLDLKWIDPQANLVWYPMVLHFPNTGIVFPDGTSKSDWSWRAAMAVDVAEQDKTKYPIPGQSGQFYSRKVDMESSKLFDRDSFTDACKFVGLIK